MKKIIMLSIVFATLFTNAFAQNKLTIYATGNYGVYKVKPSDIYTSAISSNSSVGFGVHLSYTIIPNLYIVALPVYQQRGYMSSNIYHNYDIRVSYIDIPIGVEYNFNAPSSKFLGLTDDDEKPLFVGMGLYEGFAISGNFTDKFTNNPAEKIKFGESLTDNRSSTDFGLNFNIGLRIRNFKLGIQKQLGLKNVVPTARQAAEGSIKTTGFGMFIAYKITNRYNKK